MSLSLWNILLFAVLALLGVGLYGLMVSRNLIKLIVALQILVKGTILALVTAGRMQGQVAISQSLALTVIVVDTIVAVVGMALAVQVRRRQGTLDVQTLSRLKG